MTIVCSKASSKHLFLSKNQSPFKVLYSQRGNPQWISDFLAELLGPLSLPPGKATVTSLPSFDKPSLPHRELCPLSNQEQPQTSSLPSKVSSYGSPSWSLSVKWKCIQIFMKETTFQLPWWSVLRLQVRSAGGPSSILGLGIRSHMLQLVKISTMRQLNLSQK